MHSVFAFQKGKNSIPLSRLCPTIIADYQYNKSINWFDSSIAEVITEMHSFSSLAIGSMFQHLRPHRLAFR